MVEKVLRSQRIIYPYSFVILFETVFPCKQVNNLWNIGTVYLFLIFPEIKIAVQKIEFYIQV